MASINKKTPPTPAHTHEGAITKKITNAEELLRRAVMSCLLWEDTHYESGVSIAQRIKDLIPQLPANKVAEIALEARTLMKLRHVPLLLVREMARLSTHKHLVSRTLEQVIQRPDELSEFMSIYWSDDKNQSVSSQVKKGLAAAFNKFSEYALAKYNQDKDVKLRDVLFLSHAKPKTGVAGFTRKARKAGASHPQDPGSDLFKKLITGTLKTPDTWEVEISAKGNNKDSWERLLKEKKLGDLALIRNLRNMTQAEVTPKLVSQAVRDMKGTVVLPFRYIAAAIHAPKFEPDLEVAFMKTMEGKPKLKGKTILIVDVSGSMYHAQVSQKSDMDRARAGCALAMIARELCEDPVIYATAGYDSTRIHKTQLVPSRRGFALSDAIYALTGPLGGGGIFLTQVMNFVQDKEKTADRIIVFTDEQDCDISSRQSPDKANAFGTHNYIVNVNTYDCGVAYGTKWVHINGWSEAVLDYIRIFEEGVPTGQVVAEQE